MDTFLDALISYAYGTGWLVLCIVFAIIGFKVFDKFCPIDFKQEIEKGNTAFALLIGLFLFGLTFGILYFAAHLA